jgi:hypothetical protein
MKKLLFLTLLLVASCTPLVPMDGQGPQRDLYVDSQNARATSDALLQQAQLQEQFLTATAQAPIIHITETAAAQMVSETQAAAALAQQQQYWTTTAQSMQETQTSAMTQTAMMWTTTPNATSTAIFAALNAEGTQIAHNVERDRLELERERIGNNFEAIRPGILIIVGLLGFIVLLMLFVRRERYRPAPVDARGNVIPLLDVVEGTVTDVDRNPNYRGLLSDNLFKRWLEKQLKLPPLLPEITAERQDATTQRDQLLDLATRGLPDGAAKKELKKLAGQEMTRQLSAANLESRFKILDESTSKLEVIDGQIIDVLDQEWKEAETK